MLNKETESDTEKDEDSDSDSEIEVNPNKLTLDRLKLALKYEQKQVRKFPFTLFREDPGLVSTYLKVQIVKNTTDDVAKRRRI